MEPRSSIHCVSVYLIFDPALISSPRGLILHMSLMEGKGISGVAVSLSMVRLS